MLIYERTHKELCECKSEFLKIKNQQEQLATQKLLVENKIARLEKVILEEMKRGGVQKQSIGNATYSWRKGRESVIVPDVDALPDDFVRFKKEADKTKLKEYLRNNKANFASIETGEDYLVVKGGLR